MDANLCVYPLGQMSANYGPWVKSGLPQFYQNTAIHGHFFYGYFMLQ